MKANRAIKIIAAICFVSLAAALLVARNSPATAYEPSIYTATPALVWGCLFFSIACGIGIIVHQAFRRQEHSNLWVIGLVLILFSNTIILSLHILRGYALWCGSGDPSSHLRAIQSVIATGHVSVERNFYPITHIYLAQLSQITGLGPIIFHKWIPVLFALLSMMFMYFLAKYLMPSKGHMLLATVAGSALLFGWYLNLTPNHLSVLVFPLALYLSLKSFSSGTWQWKLLFIVIVFLLPVYHPVPAFVLFLVVLGLWLPRKFLPGPSQNHVGAATDAFRFNGTIAALLLVWIVTWISSFYIWNSTIRNLHTLATEGGPANVDTLADQITRAQGYGYSITEYFFKAYGGIAVYIILALAALPILRKRLTTSHDLGRLVALYGPLAMIAVVVGILYITNVTFSPLRILVFIPIMCVFFGGFMFYEFFQ